MLPTVLRYLLFSSQQQGVVTANCTMAGSKRGETGVVEGEQAHSMKRRAKAKTTFGVAAPHGALYLARKSTEPLSSLLRSL